jgi:hypothetical protein
MKEFPDHLVPANKHKFPKYRYERNLAYLRKEITELVLRCDENTYFALDVFARANSVKKDDMEKMTKVVMTELTGMGWNTKTSFAGTGLFVYSTDTPPPSCYEDEF